MQNLLVKTQIFVGVKQANESLGVVLTGVDLKEVESLDVLDYLVLEKGGAHTSEAQVGFVHHGFPPTTCLGVFLQPIGRNGGAMLPLGQSIGHSSHPAQKSDCYSG